MATQQATPASARSQVIIRGDQGTSRRARPVAWAAAVRLSAGRRRCRNSEAGMISSGTSRASSQQTPRQPLSASTPDSASGQIAPAR